MGNKKPIFQLALFSVLGLLLLLVTQTMQVDVVLSAALSGARSLSPSRAAYWAGDAPASTGAAKPAVSAGGPSLALRPATAEIAVDEIFVVDVVADTGTQPVDGAQVFLDFDPAYLAVVDETGTPVSAITPGTAFDVVMLNSVDNTTGRINFAAGQLVGSPPAGSFTVAGMRFKGLAATSGTVVHISTVAPRASKLSFGGANLLDKASDGQYVIIGVITQTPTFTRTRTPSMTRTWTPTAMRTQTPTATMPNTATPSRTSTSTATPTWTPTATYTHTPAPTRTPTNTVSPTQTASPPTSSPTLTPTATPRLLTGILVNAGGPTYTDTAGHVWQADRAYQPGSWGYYDVVSGGGTWTDTSGSDVEGTVDDGLYRTQRWWPPSARTIVGGYKFDVQNGRYEVSLRFAEIYYWDAGQRVFDVIAEGETVVQSLDLFALYDRRWVAHDVTFQSVVADGQLNIALVGFNTRGGPAVNALRVSALDGPPAATFTPTRTYTATPTATRTPTATSTATPTPTTPAGSTVVLVDPASTSVPRAGGPVTLTIAIQNVSDLGGFELGVLFDPGVISVTNVVLGSFPASTGRTVVPMLTTGSDRVTFGAFSFGTQSGPSGAGALALLTIQPAGAGSSPIELAGVQVTDTSGRTIPVMTQDGMVAVTSCIFADFNCDCVVDIQDIQMAAAHWNTTPSSLEWDPRFDVDHDLDVDIADIQTVSAAWGTRCPPPGPYTTW